MKRLLIPILNVVPCTMLLLFPGSHVVVGLLGTSAECRAAEFRTKTGFRADDISSDGSTVLWGMLDPLTSTFSGLVESRGGDTWETPEERVQGIEGSGGFVVGSGAIWSQNGDVQLVGGSAWDISADGQTAVGRFDLSCVDRFNCVERGFLWTDAKGRRTLAPTQGFEESHAFGVSADGRVAVGRSSNDLPGHPAEATIWINHEDGEIETIGLGQPNGEDTGAAFVSDDGSVVTGIVGKRFGGWLTAFRNDPEKTFRWTETEGMVTLDLLSGTVSSTPTGISGDGSFIVGNAETESGRMFVWDGQHGTRDLETVLIEEHGLDSDIFPVADGEIRWVTALSSDGTALAGEFGGTIETGRETGWVAYLDRPINTSLVAGDADQDLDFDQLDLVQVQIAGKYLSGRDATWGEGDWNGAPKIEGDGVFDQNDIVAALQANVYLTGPYAAIKTNGSRGDGQTSLTYDARTGELVVDAPVGNELTSINITSASGMFLGDKPAALDGAFDNFAADNVFKATFGGSFGSISFGNVLPAGIAESDVAADLTAVGSLAGGGDLGNVDLVYIPEPSTVVLLFCGVVTAFVRQRRWCRRD